MLSRLLLWLLFIGLTPAGPEMVEWVTHYVQEGDFADAPDHPRIPSQDSEHGCAVLCHACSCHGPSTTARYARQTPGSQQVSRVVWTLHRILFSQETPEPPTPPPNS